MHTLTQTEEKTRGSQRLNPRSVVVETPQRGTQGILTTPFVMETERALANARGKKKVSSHDEKSLDFSRASPPLLDNQKQSSIFLIDAKQASKKVDAKDSLQREELARAFEDRGYIRQADNLRECGKKWIYYECVNCGSPGRAKSHCGMRVCRKCADRIKGKLLAKYKKGIAGLSDYRKSRLRLVTLTLRNVPELQGPDFNVISLIKHAFYKLRWRPSLRDKIYGGIYGVEATNKGKGWHVHLHVLISCEFIEDACKEMKEAKNRIEEKIIEREKCSHCKNKCLRRLWQEETNSTVVDIRKANTDAIIEIIGYIAKPSSTKKAELLVDWWEVMRNRPFVKTFGCFRKMDEIKVRLTCPWCGGQKFKVYYGGSIFLRDSRPDVERSPPLGIDIENFLGILFFNPTTIVVASIDDNGFEDRIINLESNLEFLVGTYE